jgi:hypothetical protein
VTIAAVLVGAGLLGCQREEPRQDQPTVDTTSLHRVTILASEPFYRERSEPEETFVGVLEETPGRLGPNTRNLPFRLQTATERLGVYATGPQIKTLKKFTGAKVTVIAKRIDLTSEGFTKELWIAAIARSR